jgi:hypothetical protein
MKATQGISPPSSPTRPSRPNLSLIMHSQSLGSRALSLNKTRSRHKYSERWSDGLEILEPIFVPRLFCENPLGYKGALVFIFMQFVINSVLYGQTCAIKLILFSKGATFSDQSKLSLTDYPYSFIFLISPFLDRYFFKCLGRSKTYFIPISLILAWMCLQWGSQLDTLIDNKEIDTLLVLLFAMGVAIAILGSVGECLGAYTVRGRGPTCCGCDVLDGRTNCWDDDRV